MKLLAPEMQKHLDDLLREAGVAAEWRTLLGDLDRLTQTRSRHKDADWLVRADASPRIGPDRHPRRPNHFSSVAVA